MLMNSKPHLWVMLDTWVCWLCSTSLLNKDHVHPRCSSMRSVFSRLLTRLSQLAGSMRDSITRVFPPVSHVSSALCPGVTGFHQLSSYGSVRRCSPVQDAQRVSFVPESGSQHDWPLLSIDSPAEYTVRFTSLPPFPATCPGAIRSWTTLLCYAGCVR
jgi:hypothetical protein